MFGFISGIHHQSPADNMVLLPQWAYQALGVCGEQDTAETIHVIRTALREFAINKVRAAKQHQQWVWQCTSSTGDR